HSPFHQQTEVRSGSYPKKRRALPRMPYGLRNVSQCSHFEVSPDSKPSAKMVFKAAAESWTRARVAVRAGSVALKPVAALASEPAPARPEPSRRQSSPPPVTPPATVTVTSRARVSLLKSSTKS